MVREVGLDALGGDVLSGGGDDDVLFPADDAKRAVLFEGARVAGVHETGFIYQLGRGAGVI